MKLITIFLRKLGVNNESLDVHPLSDKIHMADSYLRREHHLNFRLLGAICWARKKAYRFHIYVMLTGS